MRSTSKFPTKNLPLLPVTLGIGVGVGIAVFCAIRSHRRRNTFLARTRRQAEDLARQMADAGSAAADILDKGREEFDRQAKGLANAVEAGKRAFHRSVA